MNSTQQPNTAHWGKAIALAIGFLIILTLLFSRSSCSRNLEAAKNENAQSETDATSSENAKQDAEVDSAGHSKKEDNDKDAADASGDSEAETEDEPSIKEEAKPLEKVPESEKESDTGMQAAAISTDEESATSSGSGDPVGQNIGGLAVRGERLGVILDVSGSMTRYLESLRKEIRAGFADAEFREVEGCLLEPIDPSALPDVSSVARESVMDAIAELVLRHRVDAIYWFCDLQDERTEEAVRQLRALAHGQAGSSSGFRLYIRSTDELPDPRLEEIIRSSGGAFERSR